MLTESRLRAAKAAPKPVKLFDGGGMYLLLHPNGSKYWRLKYRYGGKEKKLALGIYPAVSLKQARERRDNARRQLANGHDPSAERKAEQETDPECFEAVAREWFAKYSPHWAPSHSDKIIRRLERDLFPYLGSRPIKAINAPELLTVLRRIEARGTVETAHRVLQNAGQVFRYAVATGRAERNCAGDLRGALAPVKEAHYASVTEPKAVGELLRAIEGYQGDPVTRAALKLTPLVFVRPGELRQAEWAEFDLDKAEWRIPAAKMKSRVLHIVPLSTQAVTILKELHLLTGSGRYVFPGLRSRSRPMSANTVNAALRRLGYSKTDMTAHGFRSMASTLLNEQGWNRDAIERQLAHGERDAVRAAYNYAEHLPERRKMMQAWADYLEGLRIGSNVISFNARKQA
ncbi:integrase arm-type DNA-binding domain-containing protein [Ferrovum sp.]|uniref:tyrosine-type recombinase/integrase n=1 Tax=Ferrovum sp. TaxID=2609467 RepID=UPI0026253072|nr:integrase arm-type DNA-binding domain-containing protein [Ferrovum sp.]